MISKILLKSFSILISHYILLFIDKFILDVVLIVLKFILIELIKLLSVKKLN